MWGRTKKSGGKYRSFAFRAFGCLFRLTFVFVVCLILYLYAQRIKIAEFFIHRELHNHGVYDLNFKLSELSFSRFEVTDIAWGEVNDPFLFISSVRLFYSPGGLVKREIDNLEIGFTRTVVKLDENNKLYFEAQLRLNDLLNRLNAKYGSSGKIKSDADAQWRLTQVDVSRCRLALENQYGVQQGELSASARVNGLSGQMRFSCSYALPDGRNLVCKGKADAAMEPPAYSNLISKFEIELPIEELLPKSLSFTPRLLKLQGDFAVRNLKTQPQWSLALTQVNSELCMLRLPDVLTVGKPRLDADFSGTVSNFHGSAKLVFNDMIVRPQRLPQNLTVSNNTQSVVLDLMLPPTEFAHVGEMVAQGNARIINLNCSVEDKFKLTGLHLSSDFALSTNGIDFGETRLEWADCVAVGLSLQPQQPQMTITNGVLDFQAEVIIPEDKLSVELDARVPVKSFNDAVVKVEMPSVRLDENSKTAQGIGRSFPAGSHYSGVIAGYGVFDKNKYGRAVAGKVTLRDGYFEQAKFRVKGVAVDMPFEFDSGLRSKGRPLLTVESMEAGNIRMESGEAYFHLPKDELFVESINMRWAGGFLNAYSIHAGFDGVLRNEFTIYADRVDLGSVFALVIPFEGEMQGVLYGRFPVGVKNNRIELSSGYLYSLPDQGGYLRIKDPANMAVLLRRAGIHRDTDEIAKALSDLDLSTIRLDLDPRDNENSSLRLRLAGRSKYVKRPAPVDLNLNLNGPLEEILNLGVDLQRLKN